MGVDKPKGLQVRKEPRLRGHKGKGVEPNLKRDNPHRPSSYREGSSPPVTLSRPESPKLGSLLLSHFLPFNHSSLRVDLESILLFRS